MKILLLGATGGTGQSLLEQAVRAGHCVVAIVRSPDKLDPVKERLESQEQERLSVVKGDVFSSQVVEDHAMGADVVVSTLGFSIKDRNLTGYSDVTKILVEAMAKTDCNRLTLMHSFFTKPESRSTCPLLLRYFFLPIIRPALDDMDRAEQFLRSIQEGEPGSDIEWTCVCPPGLNDGPVTDKPFLTTAGLHYVTDSSVGIGTRISRSDVARFLLKECQEGKHPNNVVAVCV